MSTIYDGIGFFILVWKIQSLLNLKRLRILQAAVAKDAPISVSRVTWSPDGNFVGMGILCL